MDDRGHSGSGTLLRVALLAGVWTATWGCVGGAGRRTQEPALPAAGEIDIGTSTPTDSCPLTRGQVVMDLVNRYRQAEGMVPLRVDERLVDAALGHARDLSMLDGAPGHAGSDGSEPADRAAAAGYPWVRIGENVASAVPSASSVVGIWMNSEGHRHNILTPEFEDAGVGYLDAPGSQWGTYWVMVYGTPASDGSEHRLPCHP